MSARAEGVPAALAGELAGRCRIRRELGRGGMATVFLAEDVKHGAAVRPVVLLLESQLPAPGTGYD